MKACTHCRRHVFFAESTCPFCGTVLRETSGQHVVMSLGLAAALTGCSPNVDATTGEAGDGTSATGNATSSGESSSSTTSTSSSSSPTSSSTSEGTSSSTSFPPRTTSDGSSTLDSGDFIGDDVASGGVYGVRCSTWNQDCSPGEKCMPWANDGGNAWNATRCSPISPTPALLGEECSVEGSAVSGVDDCDAGLLCFDVDPNTNRGTCVAMCEGDEATPLCSDPDRTCSASNEGVLILCLTPCDPLAQDCPDGQTCMASTTEFVCARPGDAALGEPCQQFVDCGPALNCVEGATADCDGSCCTPACDPTGPACADASQMCVPFDDAGVCVL